MDVAEAWVVLGAWVLAVAVGLLAGLAATGVVERSLDRQRAERRVVTAVLAEDAAGRTATPVADGARVRVMVRWSAPDETVRTGLTEWRPTPRQVLG